MFQHALITNTLGLYCYSLAVQINGKDLK